MTATAARSPTRALPAPAWPARAVAWPGLAGALITVLLTLPAWAPVLSPAFSLWQVDDGRLHLHRAFFLAQLIKDGNWLPRWMPQEFGGYGYPTFNFYAPGFYYLTVAAAMISGQGLYFGMQAVTGLACATIVLGIYWLAWEVTHRALAAFLAAVCVAYGPYVIQGNVFLSGSMTHALGLAWMALLLAACLAVWRRASEGLSLSLWWWLVAGCTAAVFLSHNAVAAVTAGVAAAWLICLFLWRPGLWPLLATGSAAASGALGVAFFWLPALLETTLVQIENNQHGNLNYHNHFLAWPGLHREDVWGLQSRGPWTVGFPIDLHLLYPNSLYGPVRLGLWQALIWLAGVAALLWLARRAARGRHLPVHLRLPVLAIGYGVVVAALCYAQTFDWALPWWERFAILRSIQLPSRLLAPAMFSLALVLAGTTTLWSQRAGWRSAWGAAAAIGAVLVVSGVGGRRIPYDAAAPHEMSVATVAADERAQPGFTDSMDEFLPRTSGLVTWHEGEARGFWLYERMFPEASWTGGRVRAWQGPLAILEVRGQSLWTTASVQADGPGAAIAFHQLAFPGWRAWVDGRPVSLAPAAPIESQAITPGFIVVEVPAGRHDVAIRFGPDGPRLVGAAVSLGMLAAAAAWLWWRSWHAARRRIAFAASGALLALTVAGLVARTLAPLRPPM